MLFRSCAGYLLLQNSNVERTYFWPSTNTGATVSYSLNDNSTGTLTLGLGSQKPFASWLMLGGEVGYRAANIDPSNAVLNGRRFSLINADKTDASLDMGGYYFAISSTIVFGGLDPTELKTYKPD